MKTLIPPEVSGDQEHAYGFLNHRASSSSEMNLTAEMGVFLLQGLELETGLLKENKTKLNLAQMIPLGFFQIFIIVKINNIWVYYLTLPILLNQGAISELKACTQKNANPTFQRHLPLAMGSIFVPVTVLHSSNCHALL